MSNNSDKRGRGILTPTDRAFLWGEKEYKNPETVSHRRADIRDRVRNAIIDFTILRNYLPVSERRKIFPAAGLGASPGNLEDEPLEQGVLDSMVFLYLANAQTGAPGRWEFVEDMVEMGERELHSDMLFSADLEVEQYDRRQMALVGRRRMRDEEELTNVQIRALLETGLVDPDEVAQHLRGE